MLDQIALEKEVERLQCADSLHNDFLAMMHAEMLKYPCMCQGKFNDSTPPMMWPEWLACIVKRAGQGDSTMEGADNSVDQPALQKDVIVASIECIRQTLHDVLGDEDFRKSGNCAKLSELLGAAIVQLAQWNGFKKRL